MLLIVLALAAEVRFKATAAAAQPFLQPAGYLRHFTTLSTLHALREHGSPVPLSPFCLQRLLACPDVPCSSSIVGALLMMYPYSLTDAPLRSIIAADTGSGLCKTLGLAGTAAAAGALASAGGRRAKQAAAHPAAEGHSARKEAATSWPCCWSAARAGVPAEAAECQLLS